MIGPTGSRRLLHLRRERRGFNLRAARTFQGKPLTRARTIKGLSCKPIASSMRNTIYYCNHKRTMKLSVRWCLVHLIFLLCLYAEFTSCAPVREDDASTAAPPVAQPPNEAWEQARQLWNGVRQLRKELVRRNKREEPTPTSRPARSADDIDLDNVSAPAYVKELYLNLTKQSNIDDTTLIRSLAAIQSNAGEYYYPLRH